MQDRRQLQYLALPLLLVYQLLRGLKTDQVGLWVQQERITLVFAARDLLLAFALHALEKFMLRQVFLAELGRFGLRAQGKVLPLLLPPQGLDVPQRIRKPIQVLLALGKERADLLPCVLVLRFDQRLGCLLQVLLVLE